MRDLQLLKDKDFMRRRKMLDTTNKDLANFKEYVKQLSIPELVILQYDLRKFPEDKEFLEIVLNEIKERKI